ncbi:MAG TPA: hypothetical protein VHF89_14970 [Solirubrobacteraceae bacterium]|nr:hypothetical protein [Solirubrobacteraceae bacterium]
MERQWTTKLQRELDRYAQQVAEQREDEEIAAELTAAGLMWQDPVVVEVRRHGGRRVIAA